MYDKHNRDEECFIIIKRPCRNFNNNSCNFPKEIRFEDDDRQYDNYSDGYQDYNFDKFSEKRQSNHNCGCGCEQKRPGRIENNQRKRCCFNFFRCC